MGGPDNVFNYAPTNKHTNSLKGDMLTLELAVPVLGIVKMVYAPNTIGLIAEAKNTWAGEYVEDIKLRRQQAIIMRCEERVRSIEDEATESLLKIGRVFDVVDVKGLGYWSGIEDLCAKWERMGLIESAWNDSGIFLNSLAPFEDIELQNIEIISKYLERKTKIIEGIIPKPIIIGEEALHQAGWTTRKNEGMEVAIPVKFDPEMPRFNNIRTSPRRPEWYLKLFRSASLNEDRLPVVPPEVALADAPLIDKRFPKRRFREHQREKLLRATTKVWVPKEANIRLPNDAHETISEALRKLDASDAEVEHLTKKIGLTVHFDNLNCNRTV